MLCFSASSGEMGNSGKKSLNNHVLSITGGCAKDTNILVQRWIYWSVDSVNVRTVAEGRMCWDGMVCSCN